jgi:hypothetical protein
MQDKDSKGKRNTARRLYDIESKPRVSSDSMETLEDQPKLLRAYLETSLSNTFSELMFRLTHEVYAEDKAADLWRMIAQHRADLEERLGRDMGMLVAALDYLSNISGDMLNPKIMSDVRIEEAATMATRDPLTGLYLRGVFDFTLERMVSEHLRRAEPISLLMCRRRPKSTARGGGKCQHPPHKM